MLNINISKWASIISITIAILLGFMLIITNVQSCHKMTISEKEDDKNVSALLDSLKTYRLKDSSQVATIQAFEYSSQKDFLKIKSQEEDINKLQKLVKSYKGKLESATTFSSDTKVDYSGTTTVLEDTINKYPTYKSDVNLGNWLYGSVLANKDSTYLNLSIKNDYDVTIGYKKKIPYAEVTNHNPYSSTTSLRTYQVSIPKPKRWGVGFHIGYGLIIQEKPILRPDLSVGVNYNLIEF